MSILDECSHMDKTHFGQYILRVEIIILYIIVFTNKVKLKRTRLKLFSLSVSLFLCPFLSVSISFLLSVFIWPLSPALVVFSHIQECVFTFAGLS